jgi:hypothetical protein
MKKKRTLLKGKIYRLNAALAIAALLVATLTPLMMGKEVLAYGQITNRTLTTSSGVPSNTGVTYTFTFKTASTTSAIASMKFVACTTAIATYPEGDCSAGAPPGLDLSAATYTSGSQAGFTDNTAFALDGTGNTGGGLLTGEGCDPSQVNVLCINRTSSTTDTEGAATTKTIAFTGITNPSSANTSFYIGMYTYTNGDYTGLVDFGATASAVVQTLETDAFVAEVLQFCIGATLVDGLNTPVTDLVATDCAGQQGTALGGTTVNIGTLDTSAINVSPVTSNGGDSNNGVAMVRSNAGNGVIIDYDAIQQTGTNHLGTLRISGASCDDPGGPNPNSGGIEGVNDNTDACINAKGTTQGAFTAGVEQFGMTVAGVNSVGTTSYSCQYGDAAESVAAGNTCHLEPAVGVAGLGGYLGGGGVGSETYDTFNGFAWDETGTPTTIASSAGSTIKQVDDEALILKFAATPSITTPFGRYKVQTDFIAIPTY